MASSQDPRAVRPGELGRKVTEAEEILRAMVSHLNLCTCDCTCFDHIPDDLIERAEELLGLPFGWTAED